jgi:cell division inhibitor SulA
MNTPEPALLDALLRSPHVWRGDGRADVAVPSVGTGHAALDAILPGGGWPRAALTELLVTRPGIGELSLLLPALARLSREDQWIALAAPPHVPYAPALASASVNLARLLVVSCVDGSDTLWAMEQALASGSCSAVLGWPSFLNERSLRRLQLAAETGRAIGICFSLGQATSSSLAALRLQLSPAGDRLRVHVLKVRGSGSGTTLLLDVRPTCAERRRTEALNAEDAEGSEERPGGRS